MENTNSAQYLPLKEIVSLGLSLFRKSKAFETVPRGKLSVI